MNSNLLKETSKKRAAALKNIQLMMQQAQTGAEVSVIISRC